MGILLLSSRVLVFIINVVLVLVVRVLGDVAISDNERPQTHLAFLKMGVDDIFFISL